MANIPKLKDRYPPVVPALCALEARIAGLDLEHAFDALVPEGARGGKKYLDLPRHVVKNYERVRNVGLLEGPPRRILDLGAGSGVFCFVAQAYGHHAVALERPGSPTRINYGELIKLYGVALSEQNIRPMRPLIKDEALAEPFDLVNATAICFNMAGGQLWDADAYMFFLRDLRDNFLAPGARIVLRFNGMLYGGRPRANHNSDGADYYRALGRMLEPFAIDPQPGPVVVLDPFRAEFTTDATLPEVLWTDIVANEEDESDEEEEEANDEELEGSPVAVLPVPSRRNGRASRLVDLAAATKSVPRPAAPAMLPAPPSAAPRWAWARQCALWLKKQFLLLSTFLGFHNVREITPVSPQSVVERVIADILARASAGDAAGLSRVESLGKAENAEVVAAIRANTDTLEMVVSAYIDGLGHASPKVRLACAQALERYGHPAAIEPLIALTQDDVPRVRWTAVSALGSGACKANAPIARYAFETVAQIAQNDPVIPVRRQATIALGQIGGSEAIALLERLADEDNDDGVRRNAIRNLRALAS